MHSLERFSLLLLQPDAATNDLYDNPSLGDAFIFVSAYALAAGLHASLTVLVLSDSADFIFSSFIGSALAVYLQWVLLALVLRGFASLFGGSGVLFNALGYTGLAAAPMVLITIVQGLALVAVPLMGEGEGREMVSSINLVLSFIGMAWGWPGLLCFYGLRNGELLENYKALLIVLIAFGLMTTYILLTSNVFS